MSGRQKESMRQSGLKKERSNVLRYRTAWFLLRKASAGGLSVETLMVLPLFLFGLITMISFMDAYRLQTEHLNRLCTDVKAEAAASFDAGRDEISRTVSFAFSPPGDFFHLGPVPFTLTVKAHAWNGSSPEERRAEGISGAGEHMVYVTATGDVIHEDLDCTYLKLSVRAVPGEDIEHLRSKSGGRYHPCESCSRGSKPGAVVYITDQGNSYHNNGACSALKRTVLLIPESEAEGYHSCPRCGGGK